MIVVWFRKTAMLVCMCVFYTCHGRVDSAQAAAVGHSVGRAVAAERV